MSERNDLPRERLRVQETQCLRISGRPVRPRTRFRRVLMNNPIPVLNTVPPSSLFRSFRSFIGPLLADFLNCRGRHKVVRGSRGCSRSFAGSTAFLVAFAQQSRACGIANDIRRLVIENYAAIERRQVTHTVWTERNIPIYSNTCGAPATALLPLLLPDASRTKREGEHPFTFTGCDALRTVGALVDGDFRHNPLIILNKYPAPMPGWPRVCAPGHKRPSLAFSRRFPQSSRHLFLHPL
jgi:hypothetical protein